MRDRRRNRNTRLSFQNVKRRRPEIAFLANQFVFAESPFHDRAAIHLQKSSRHALEHGNLQQIFRFKSFRARPFRNRSARHALVRQSSRRTRNHALAARNTGRIAHRRVQVERDARGVAFPHAAQYKIRPHFIAPAYTPVAQNARIVVHRDAQ